MNYEVLNITYCQSILHILKGEILPKRKSVTVSFGSVDPSDILGQLLALISENLLHKYEWNFILGAGYKKDIRIQLHNVNIIRDAPSIESYLRFSEYVICSGGRTAVEACALGCKVIVICQNERETLHVYRDLDNVILDLGYSEQLTPRSIVDIANALESVHYLEPPLDGMLDNSKKCVEIIKKLLND